MKLILTIYVWAHMDTGEIAITEYCAGFQGRWYMVDILFYP